MSRRRRRRRCELTLGTSRESGRNRVPREEPPTCLLARFVHSRLSMCRQSPIVAIARPSLLSSFHVLFNSPGSRPWSGHPCRRRSCHDAGYSETFYRSDKKLTGNEVGQGRRKMSQNQMAKGQTRGRNRQLSSMPLFSVVTVPGRCLLSAVHCCAESAPR